MGRERREAMKFLGIGAQAGSSNGTGTQLLAFAVSQKCSTPHPGLFPSQCVVVNIFWDPEKHNPACA